MRVDPEVLAVILAVLFYGCEGGTRERVDIARGRERVPDTRE